MVLVRSLLFAILFYAVTVVAVLAALPLIMLWPGAIERHVLHWARFYRWSARTILGIRIRVEGHPPRGAVLVAGKHEAMFETIALLPMLEHPVVVLKRELAAIPLFGRATRAWGVIPIDRDGSAPALRTMIAAARRAVAGGRPILIFPEGTRVPPGERPPLRAGFAGLYRALGVPVVPVAVDSGRLWPKGLVKRPGTITVRFGATVPAGLSRRDAETAVHAAINALSPDAVAP